LQHNLPFDDTNLWEKVDIWSLLSTWSAVLQKLSTEAVIDIYEEVTVNEKITLLSELLENNGECRLTDLIVRTQSIMDIICAILAILEAVKARMIVILQHRMFGDIMIKPCVIAAE
jgi:segregation and condensation protein A